MSMPFVCMYLERVDVCSNVLRSTWAVRMVSYLRSGSLKASAFTRAVGLRMASSPMPDIVTIRATNSPLSELPNALNTILRASSLAHYHVSPIGDSRRWCGSLLNCSQVLIRLYYSCINTAISFSTEKSVTLCMITWCW